MTIKQQEDKLFYTGILMSLAAHFVVIAIAIIRLQAVDAYAVKPATVFTVSIEGGENLGGISQTPTEDTQESKVIPAVQDIAEQAEETIVEPEPAKLEVPAVLEEERKKEEELIKQAEIEKKKELEKINKEQDRVKKDEEARKRQADEKKRQEDLAKERQERARRLREAARKAAQNYQGESYDAGGTGFGAARVGEGGMGGGVQRSIEWVAYSNALQSHIKSGWRWSGGAQRLRAQVIVRILPSGTIQDARIIASSGNQNFDDSVLRAVYKANPVPPAPAHIYNDFQQVRITFDTEDK